jgi:hypothetical protein
MTDKEIALSLSVWLFCGVAPVVVEKGEGGIPGKTMLRGVLLWFNLLGCDALGSVSYQRSLEDGSCL